jgi:hypothetical protein
MGHFLIILEGAYLLVCHFPFARTNLGLRNPPSLQNNYYDSVQTINLSFLYEQSPQENANGIHAPMTFYY